jgi:sugar lactone lactonase YvrE
MVLAEGFYFFEAPRERDGAVWMSGIVGGKVCRLDLKGRARVVAHVP